MKNGFRENLVYDVGMHNGQDTGYYLAKGYDVVAIEANPALVHKVERKYRDAINENRLRILNIGITEESGDADFFISTKKSVWSSFDKENATKDGSGYNVVRIPCVPFREILQEHGVPYYLKVDIEGNDHLCLAGLDSKCLPRYVSIESSRRGDRDMQRLSDLGYTDFKFVRQNDLTVLDPSHLSAYLASRRRASNLGLRGQFLRMTRNLWLRAFRPRQAGWAFPKGASGPVGEDLSGRWTDVAKAIDIWQALVDADRSSSGAGLGDWFDVHARR